MTDETASVPCNCLLEAHCDARSGCRLKAGATINQGGGICGPYPPPQQPVPAPSHGAVNLETLAQRRAVWEPIEKALVQQDQVADGKRTRAPQPEPVALAVLRAAFGALREATVPAPSDEAVEAGLDAVSWGEIQQGAADPREAAAYAIRAALKFAGQRVRAEERAKVLHELETIDRYGAKLIQLVKQRDDALAKLADERAATLREVAPLCEFVESLAAEDPATVSKYHAIGAVLLARHALAAHFNQEADRTT